MQHASQMKNLYNFLVGIPEGKRPFRTLGVDGRITVKVESKAAPVL
jgi:hypothetical protein